MFGNHPVTGVCYWSGANIVNFEGAYKQCLDDDGILAIIDDQVTQDYFEAAILPYYYG